MADGATNFSQFAREAVRKQTLYTLGAPPDADVKINQNEAPFDLPDALKQEVFEHLMTREWHKYPSIDAAELRERLSALWHWPAEGIVIGNGSNHLLSVLYRTMVNPGDRVVMPTPCFSTYAMQLEHCGAHIDTVRVDRHGFDTEALVAKAKGAKLVMVASPNNPTGTVLPMETLDALLQSGAMIALDEAYAEYLDVDGLSRMGQDVPLIIFRTFSKAWGIGGVRFGAMMGPTSFMAEVKKVILPFAVGTMTRAVAHVMLNHADERMAILDEIKSERERVRGVLEAAGLRPWPSESNFIVFEPKDHTPAEMFDALLSLGVMIRNISGTIPGALRVSISNVAHNDRFIETLHSVLGA
ncbi:MAG: histidinol-phosphate aminotransferase [Myxococcota bacterium]|jgi:histidinol-phosphate aminotransferase